MPKETILIADDDPLTIQMLSSHLKESGYQVAIAADVMQAVMYSMRTVPAAVLLDIKMPGGSGVDVLKKLKSSIKTSHVPVIVVTGSEDPELPEKVKTLGADGFLPKPVNLQKLDESLRRFLGEPFTGG